MSYPVITGVVLGTDKVPEDAPEEQEESKPQYHPVVVHSHPAAQVCALTQKQTGPSKVQANSENLRPGITVVRKIKPSRYGVVTNVTWNFGSVKSIQQVWIKFQGKDIALPYKPEDLLVVYLN